METIHLLNKILHIVMLVEMYSNQIQNRLVFLLGLTDIFWWILTNDTLCISCNSPGTDPTMFNAYELSSLIGLHFLVEYLTYNLIANRQLQVYSLNFHRNGREVSL